MSEKMQSVEFFVNIFAYFREKVLYLQPKQPERSAKMSFFMKLDVFIVKVDGKAVAFLDSASEVARHLGVTVSAVSRAMNEDRAMRGNIFVEKKPRIVLCRVGDGVYNVRTAKKRGKDYLAAMDITECYYKEENVIKKK